MPLPERIKNAPTLWPGLEFYYGAFLDLMDCRQIGLGEGPIPWTARDQYCASFGLEGSMAQDLHYHVARLDKVYLEHKRKKSKSPPPVKSPPKRR